MTQQWLTVAGLGLDFIGLRNPFETLECVQDEAGSPEPGLTAARRG